MGLVKSRMILENSREEFFTLKFNREELRYLLDAVQLYFPVVEEKYDRQQEFEYNLAVLGHIEKKIEQHLRS
jgi:hypothetical protein